MYWAVVGRSWLKFLLYLACFFLLAWGSIQLRFLWPGPHLASSSTVSEWYQYWLWFIHSRMEFTPNLRQWHTWYESPGLSLCLFISVVIWQFLQDLRFLRQTQMGIYDEDNCQGVHLDVVHQYYRTTHTQVHQCVGQTSAGHPPEECDDDDDDKKQQ